MSNSFKLSTRRIISVMYSTGRSIGSVTNRNTRHVDAPSVRAASWGPSGSVESAANVISMTNGMDCHESTRAIDTRAAHFSPSQPIRDRPTESSNQLITPRSVSSMNRHIRPTATGVNSIGSNSAVRKNRVPRRLRLSTTASTLSRNAGARSS